MENNIHKYTGKLTENDIVNLFEASFKQSQQQRNIVIYTGLHGLWDFEVMMNYSSNVLDRIRNITYTKNHYILYINIDVKHNIYKIKVNLEKSYFRYEFMKGTKILFTSNSLNDIKYIPLYGK